MAVTQYSLAFELQPLLCHDNFFVSDSNRDAFSWLENWPKWPSHGLIVYGDSGCGKSHLASMWKQRAHALVLPAHDLAKKPPQELLKDARAVLIENAERTTDEESLFHLLNHIAAHEMHILLTASIAPSAWRLTLADLRSRLAALPAIAISAPDDSLLSALIVKLFSDRQLRVTPDVVAYIISRIERSFAAAHHIVDQLDTLSLETHREITIPLVRDVLK